MSRHTRGKAIKIATHEMTARFVLSLFLMVVTAFVVKIVSHDQVVSEGISEAVRPGSRR
jgi:hypothetical protein